MRRYEEKNTNFYPQTCYRRYSDDREAVFFPGIESYYTNKMKFSEIDNEEKMPTFRILDLGGKVINKSYEPEVKTKNKNLQAPFFKILNNKLEQIFFLLYFFI